MKLGYDLINKDFYNYAGDKAKLPGQTQCPGKEHKNKQKLTHGSRKLPLHHCDLTIIRHLHFFKIICDSF